MARARGMDGHGHREATRQEHKRHGCAEIRFESMTSRCEPGVIKRPVHDVAGEDATKKEHFRSEKDPHAEIAGVALLSDVLELMVKCRIRAMAPGRGQWAAGGAFRHALPSVRRSHRARRRQ